MFMHMMLSQQKEEDVQSLLIEQSCPHNDLLKHLDVHVKIKRLSESSCFQMATDALSPVAQRLGPQQDLGPQPQLTSTSWFLFCCAT